MPMLVAARAELRHMRTHPKPLARPVIALSGWGDMGFLARQISMEIRRGTGDTRVAEASFFLHLTFPACRQKVVERVEKTWPSADPHETVEVDVVAHSMGGLIARFAALPERAPGFGPAHLPLGKRLRIHTLYTVGTPHLGANQAKLFHMADARARDMMPGSVFLEALNAAPLAHAIVPYGIHGDWVVGAANIAPIGTEAQLFERRPLRPSHAGATTDSRILASILKRLRGE